MHVTEAGTLSPALTDVFLPFRKDRLGDAVCIEVSPIGTIAIPSAQTVLDAARQTHWQGLLAAARAGRDEATQRAITREAFQAITVQRQEEIQRPRYFVTNRPAH